MSSFRVKVDLSQVFNDERQKVYVFIPNRKQCTVRWLVTRLVELVGSPSSLMLLVDGHLLPNEETLEVLQVGDLVSAIPTKKICMQRLAQDVPNNMEVLSTRSRPSSLEPEHTDACDACTNNEALLKVKQQALNFLNQYQKVPDSTATDISIDGSTTNHYDEPDHSVALSSNISTFRGNSSEDKAPRRRRRVRRRKVPATDFSVPALNKVTDLVPVSPIDQNHVDESRAMAPESHMEVLVTKSSNLLQLDEDSANNEQMEENGEEIINPRQDHSTPQPTTQPYGRLITSS